MNDTVNQAEQTFPDVAFLSTVELLDQVAWACSIIENGGQVVITRHRTPCARLERACVKSGICLVDGTPERVLVYSISDLTAHCKQLLDAVLIGGHTIVLRRFGQPIALLKPVRE